MIAVWAIILLALVVTPLFRVDGYYGWDQAKEQLFLAFMCIAMGTCSFTVGLPVPSHPAVWLWMAYVGLASVSLLWSDYPTQARRELPRLWSLTALVLIGSMVPSRLLLWAVFIPAPFVATYGIVQQIFRWDPVDPRYHKNNLLRKKTRFLTWFAGSNYAGAYLAPQIFIGLWLWSTGGGWPTLAAALLIVAGTALSLCRAAWAGVAVAAAALQPWLIIPGLLAGACYWFRRQSRAESMGHRYWLVRVAWEMGKARLLTGWGPRSFRTHHARALVDMNQRDPTILGDDKTPGRYRFLAGRRAHNDWIENLADYGLPGFLLFAGFGVAAFVAALQTSSVLAAAVAATLVNAFFFMPFRDTGVCLPFLAVVAAVTGPSTVVAIPLWASGLIALVAGILAWEYAFKPFAANQMVNAGEMGKAVEMQPFASWPLTHALIRAFDAEDYVMAFNCAEKALYHYDGEKHEWDALTLFGVTARTCGAVFVARAAFRRALELYPGYDPAIQGLREVEEVIGQAG